MLLSVIIPTYNGKPMLERGIPSLLASLQSIKDSELIIVDNNSKDDTKQFITTRFPDIKYFKFNKNTGFTGAVNKGIKEAQADYLLILNNDCFLQQDTIQKMVELLSKNPQYCATQPVVYSQNSSVENIGYIVDTYVGKAEVVKDINFKFNAHLDMKKRYLYGLSATCLLIKSDVIESVGMFDEKFHSYLEDVDLFLRLLKKGYSYYPTLDSQCVHVHMSTSSKMGSYKEFNDLKNWNLLILKNFSPLFILSHFPTLFVERLRNLSGYIKKLATI